MVYQYFILEKEGIREFLYNLYLYHRKEKFNYEKNINTPFHFYLIIIPYKY